MRVGRRVRLQSEELHDLAVERAIVENIGERVIKIVGWRMGRKRREKVRRPLVLYVLEPSIINDHSFYQLS